jgi:hypothetical protein
MDASVKAGFGLRVAGFELKALKAETEMEIRNLHLETYLLWPTLPESRPSINFGGMNIS